MLSNGQIEIRKIINSFLEEYENFQQERLHLKDKNPTSEEFREWHSRLNQFYLRVRDTFSSNDIIKNDSVTSQLLGTSPYSRKYLQWLEKNGVKEKIESFTEQDFQKVDFDMRQIVYGSDAQLQPAYKGGVKSTSTISCLFGLAQGQRLNNSSSGAWECTYFDAIQLWKVGSGGNHRLLSHILFGSKKINPYRLTIIRNDFVDPLLNKSLSQFEELFDDINSSSKYHIELAFDVESLNKESITKIKKFFCDIKPDEKLDLVRCINALKTFPHEYISGNSSLMEIEIDNMSRLLRDIRHLRAKPHWYRKLLILKQKFLGIKTVDSITCTVLHLKPWERTYLNNHNLNDQGWLRHLPGLRQLLLSV